MDDAGRRYADHHRPVDSMLNLQQNNPPLCETAPTRRWPLNVVVPVFIPLDDNVTEVQ